MFFLSRKYSIYIDGFSLKNIVRIVQGKLVTQSKELGSDLVLYVLYEMIMLVLFLTV